MFHLLFIISGLKLALSPPFKCPAQYRKSVPVQLLIINIPGIVPKIRLITFLPGQQPFLNQVLQINQIGIACKRTEGLIGRIPIPGRPQRQNLPVLLPGLLQLIHKMIGLSGKASNPVP